LKTRTRSYLRFLKLILLKFRIDTDDDSDADESVDEGELLSAGMRQWTRT